MSAGEEFTHLEIFERDNWICGICGDPVDRNLRKPNPRCATLEHILPVSFCLELGWPVNYIHVRANVCTAHMDCNLKRGNQFPYPMAVRFDMDAFKDVV